uniref:Peptidase C1A papain C-terminal domain-containing protein n=1 Tax=Cacopsylla melanoneura TaxID=428564 RepID=A0A8D8LQ66_9HEMI
MLAQTAAPSQNSLLSPTSMAIWTLLYVTLQASLIFLPACAAHSHKAADSQKDDDVHFEESDLSHNDSHSPKSLFPHGLARNSIHNPPPLEEEWNLLDEHDQSVEEWKEFQLPNHFDWRKEGALTPVKDQKYCAAPYAFAVVGEYSIVLCV